MPTAAERKSARKEITFDAEEGNSIPSTGCREPKLRFIIARQNLTVGGPSQALPVGLARIDRDGSIRICSRRQGNTISRRPPHGRELLSVGCHGQIDVGAQIVGDSLRGAFWERLQPDLPARC